MFLKTFSAGCSSRDSDAIVCAEVSRQRKNAIMQTTKIIARAGSAFCRAIRFPIRKPFIPLTAWMRQCDAPVPYAPSHLAVQRQLLNRFGANRSLRGARRTRQESAVRRNWQCLKETVPMVPAVFRHNFG